MIHPPHHDDFDGSNIPDMAERRYIDITIITTMMIILEKR